MKLEEEYINLVINKFPEVSFKKVTLITKGWDNDVLILDGTYVFRFPKREKSKARFVSEVKLLEYLQLKTPLPIPNYEYLSIDPPFGGYEIIKGQEMTPQLFAGVGDNIKNTIAEQIGSFLAFLHSTPVDVAQKLGFQKEPGGYWWSKERTAERYEKLQMLVFPKLNQEEIIWARHQFDTYLGLNFDFDLTVIHSDIKGDHIFFDGGDKVTGVIDFAEAELGDPALDFTGLWSYGEDFVINTLGYYGDIKSDDFLKRSKFPHLVRKLGNMLKIAEGRTLPVSYTDLYKQQREIIDSGMSL